MEPDITSARTKHVATEMEYEQGSKMNQLIKRLSAIVTLTMALAACGSTTETVQPTDSSAQGAVTSPAAGTEVQVSLTFNDDECSNSGRVEAFEVTWRSWGPAPSEWRTLGPTVEGALRFESFDLATFTASGATHEMTYSGYVDDECEGWEVPN